ncbi:MAG: hypothetical protein KDE56_04770 [Anaerolineales bacterium]|nr:hypothetical protein [Anaerolineales bacterium]
MKNKTTLTKTLAVIGTVLIWLPVVAPIILALVMLAVRQQFLLDFLMPAELFFLVAAGSVMLLVTAFWVHRWQKLIGWSLVAAVALLVGSQGLAEVTGLASGAIPAEGWPFVAVLTLFAGYIAAVIALGVGGILLLRDLFKPGELSLVG